MGDSPLKGPYPDGDTRNVTLAPSTNPIEPERTGPREGEARGEVERREAAEERQQAEASQADLAAGSPSGAVSQTQLGETSTNPATRARADAKRPISGD
jgi:hypothetical protein